MGLFIRLSLIGLPTRYWAKHSKVQQDPQYFSVFASVKYVHLVKIKDSSNAIHIS